MEVSHDIEPWSGYWGSFFALAEMFEPRRYRRERLIRNAMSSHRPSDPASGRDANLTRSRQWVQYRASPIEVGLGARGTDASSTGYEVQALPWSGRAPPARASASVM